MYVFFRRGRSSFLRAFSSFSERGLLSSCMGFSLQSPVAGNRLQGSGASVAAARGLSSPGAGALVAPRDVESSSPGIESVSPALAGGFLSTGLQRKSCRVFLSLCLPGVSAWLHSRDSCLQEPHRRDAEFLTPFMQVAADFILFHYWRCRSRSVINLVLQTFYMVRVSPWN